LLLVDFLLVNAPKYHLFVLASVVQGDAVNCNKCPDRDLKFEIEASKFVHFVEV